MLMRGSFPFFGASKRTWWDVQRLFGWLWLQGPLASRANSLVSLI